MSNLKTCSAHKGFCKAHLTDDKTSGLCPFHITTLKMLSSGKKAPLPDNTQCALHDGISRCFAPRKHSTNICEIHWQQYENNHLPMPSYVTWNISQ